MSNRYLVHMQNAAQRWFKLHNVGPSPHRRSGHAMASDGTRVFVLGGRLDGAQPDEVSLVHVFDTSMSFLSVVSSGQPPRLRTQRTSSTRNPSVTLSILMRRSPQALRARSNHSTRKRLHRRPTVLPVCKTLPSLYWAALPPRRLHLSRKTRSAKVQPSAMRSSRDLILLLKE